MTRIGADPPQGLPVLVAVQPELPAVLQPAAVPASKETVLQAIAQGFVSAVASSVRAEILGAELEIEVPLSTTIHRIEAGTRLLVGVFAQIHPQNGVPWDGIHRGKVTWYDIRAPRTLTYEPPL